MGRPRPYRRSRSLAGAAGAIALALAVAGAPTGGASTGATGPRPGARAEIFTAAADSPRRPSVPPGFEDQVVFEGLAAPTAVAFSADHRVFVAEKGGVIQLYHGLNDPAPSVFADFSQNVMDYADRGLLGMALDPGFPAVPFVYVLYTLDAPIGSDPPVYGDDCPDPFEDGCLVGARLSRLEADGDEWTGTEQVLIEDWCQQYSSHSIGTLAFGPDGALYVGGGDGASFIFADYGQGGSPANPCRDPGGRHPQPPRAQGGALRSQDLRREGDPTSMDGAILRVDPATGDALPGNPLYGGSVPDDDRIIAFGMRNPFRFTFEPGSDRIWIGDVGWNTWEEINTLEDPTDEVVEDFGWPCYEGVGAEPEYDGADLAICEDLYRHPSAVTEPFFSYNHFEPVVPGENCPTGSSVISIIGFYDHGSYPDEYDGALFFGDTSRTCIWAMLAGTDGEPDPSTLLTFEEGAGFPVDLKRGPRGDLFYVDFYDGQLHRIRYVGTG